MKKLSTYIFICVFPIILIFAPNAAAEKITDNKTQIKEYPTMPEPTAKKFERGPSIYPAGKLLTWLEEQKQKPDEVVIRLPVLVTLKPNHMYIASATVGNRPDALAIKINDTGMRLPIVGKWAGLCGQTDSCILLLRGVWRGGKSNEFQVSSVEKVITDADEATFAEIMTAVHENSNNTQGKTVLTYQILKSYRGMIDVSVRITLPEEGGVISGAFNTAPLIIKNPDQYDEFIGRLPKKLVTKGPRKNEPSHDPLVQKPSIDFEHNMMVVVIRDFMWDPPEILRIENNGQKIVVHYRIPPKPEIEMQHAYGMGSYHAVLIERSDLEVEFVPEPGK